MLVLEAGAWIESAFVFLETKRPNAPLIIYHSFTDPQLNFVDIVLTNLKLQTEIGDSNKIITHEDKPAGEP